MIRCETIHLKEVCKYGDGTARHLARLVWQELYKEFIAAKRNRNIDFNDILVDLHIMEEKFENYWNGVTFYWCCYGNHTDINNYPERNTIKVELKPDSDFITFTEIT